MTPTNGITHYTDERVLLALARLLDGRDQSANPITQADIGAAALVSLRTVPVALNRLMETGLVISPDRQQGRPATYVLSKEAQAIVEDHHANQPCA
jgi:DNA-binding transcriptional ArsR family regulator